MHASDSPVPSRRKQVVFLGILFGLLLIAFEVGARLVFYVRDGFNPYYLMFGFRPDIEWTSRDLDGYSKFQPNVIKHYSVAGVTIPIRINSDGFRGNEFAKPKPAGAFRVVALGASSTFGFENRDSETYPYLLDSTLRARYPERLVEVLNLGIPESRMQNILALARAELPGLEPDVVTFYEGFNNALWTRAREEAGGLYRLKDWLYFHSVGWRTLHASIRAVYLKISTATNRNLIGAAGTMQPGLTFDRTYAEQTRRAVAGEFTAQLRQLVQVVRELSSGFVLVTQPVTMAYHEPNPTAPQVRPYAAELEEVRSRSATGGTLSAPQMVMVVHGDLIDSIRAVSVDASLPLVEGIAALDTDRARNVTSSVHLSRAGSLRLAIAIADGLEAAGLLGMAPGTDVSPQAHRPP